MIDLNKVKNIPDVKLGIVAVSRDCFPIAYRRRDVQLSRQLTQVTFMSAR